MSGVRRTSLAAAVILMAGLASPAWSPAAAHPGHGTAALVGTLATVEAAVVTLDVRDAGTGMVSRVRVTLDADTKLRLRKEMLPSLTPWLGASVVATVDYEEGPDGRTMYRASKIQVTPPKGKRR